MDSGESFRLDLRGVVCPMNFVKTKLFVDKLSSGQIVQVLLDPGESASSVLASVEAEGHNVVESRLDGQGYYLLSIRKG